MGARRERDGAASHDAVEHRDARGHGAGRRPGPPRDDAGGLLLYTPVVADDDFAASIAYLVAPARREHRAGELPALAVHDHARLAGVATPSGAASRPPWPHRHDVSTAPRRRPGPRAPSSAAFDPDAPFANEPDTDFTRAANRAWIAAPPRAPIAPAAPPAAASRRPPAIDAVVARARRRRRTQWARDVDRRAPAAPRRASPRSMAADRGRTLAVMAHETGQDRARGRSRRCPRRSTSPAGRPRSTRTLDELAADGVAADPLGVVLVAGPWNFPYADPGQRRRRRPRRRQRRASSSRRPRPSPRRPSWSASSTRPASPTTSCSSCRCPDDDVGRHLVTHPGVDAVVLTGSYDTARLFLGWQPDLRLLAETSGKNALVDHPTADVDLAITRPRALGVRPRRAEVLGGQPGDRRGAAATTTRTFRRRLADAVRSLRVGPATDLATMVGPLIHPPDGPAARAP